MNGKTDGGLPPRVYIDANVFITAFEKRGPTSEILVRLFLSGRIGQAPPLVTSELSLSELIVEPLEMGRSDLVQLYDNWTISNRHLEVIPVLRGVLFGAAVLRGRDRTLKLPDAIHLATALDQRCTHFLTDDSRIRAPDAIKRVSTDEETMQTLLDEIERQ